MTAPDLTPQQRSALEAVLVEAQDMYGVESVQFHDLSWRAHGYPGCWWWMHHDGDYVISGFLDHHGSASLYVGSVEGIHSSDDDECDCNPCRALRLLGPDL